MPLRLMVVPSCGLMMKPEEFKAARHALGYTVVQMAGMLGVSPRQVRRYEAPSEASSHRSIPVHTVKLLNAIQQGYRGF